MVYVVMFSIIERPGAPFDAIRGVSFGTLAKAKDFMRAKMLKFIDSLDDSPNNKSWRNHGRLALQQLEELGEPQGHGRFGPVWTKAQGGVQGRVTFLCPAPSMTIRID